MDSQGAGYRIQRNLLYSHAFCNLHDAILHDKPISETHWHQHLAFLEEAPHGQEPECQLCFRPGPRYLAVIHCNDIEEGLGSISRHQGGEI